MPAGEGRKNKGKKGKNKEDLEARELGSKVAVIFLFPLLIKRVCKPLAPKSTPSMLEDSEGGIKALLEVQNAN